MLTQEVEWINDCSGRGWGVVSLEAGPVHLLLRVALLPHFIPGCSIVLPGLFFG